MNGNEDKVRKTQHVIRRDLPQKTNLLKSFWSQNAITEVNQLEAEFVWEIMKPFLRERTKYFSTFLKSPETVCISPRFSKKIRKSCGDSGLSCTYLSVWGWEKPSVVWKICKCYYKGYWNYRLDLFITGEGIGWRTSFSFILLLTNCWQKASIMYFLLSTRESIEIKGSCCLFLKVPNFRSRNIMTFIWNSIDNGGNELYFLVSSLKNS